MGLGGGQLLELLVKIGRAEYPGVALLDKGTTHCFQSKQLPQAADLHLEMSARLCVYLAHSEQCASLGFSSTVHVTFAAGFVLYWDSWVVPLATDFNLGLILLH